MRTSAEMAEARGLGQDMERLGGEAAARDLYVKRCRPAYALYERLCDPEGNCDAIIDNDNPAHP